MGGGRIWWQLMKKKDTCGEEEVNKACLMFGMIVTKTHMHYFSDFFNLDH